MDQLTLTADVTLQAAADTGRPARVSILAYGGGLIQPTGWGRPVVIDVSTVVLGRVPLLVDHNASLQGVVGSGLATAENATITVNGTISRASDSGAKLITLARDGVAWQASVGIDVQTREQVRPGETVRVNNQTFTAGPHGLAVVRAGRLREVSILSMGADAETAVSIAAKRTEAMPDDISTDDTNSTPEASPAPALLRARVTNRYIEQTPERRPEFEQLEAAANDENWEADRLEVELLRASRVSGPSNIRTNAGGGGSTRTPSQRGLLEAGLLIRAGFEDAAVQHYGEQTAETARHNGPTNLIDLCAAALTSEHRTVPRGHEAIIKAAFSTQTLPTVLENTLGRSIIQPFMDTTSNWRSFATVKSAANFKPQKSARPSSFETLQQIGPDGEIHHTPLEEDGVYNWSIDTFARMIGVTRQTIIDDDLGFIAEYGPLLAQAAGRSLNDLVWQTIMAGAGSFFVSGNSNLMEAGSDLDITSLSEAVAKMKKQTDARGYVIDNRPVALCVPPDIEATARTLLNSAEVVGPANTASVSGNPVQGIVKNLISEARLSNAVFTGNSTAAWYLFSGPASHAVIVGFLRGQTTPTVETSNADFNQLGIQLRVYFDYGAALGDPRGGLKATGAASE